MSVDGRDPFWPVVAEGDVVAVAVETDAQAAGVVELYAGTTWRCESCGSQAVDLRSQVNPRLCSKCFDEKEQQKRLRKQSNEGWMETATAAGLELFERQPEETDEEWRLWCSYRDAYPNKLPTWSALGERVHMAPATVSRIAARWNFKVRMQAWARYVDASTQQTRVDAIKEMNERQLAISQSLQEKLAQAVDCLDPTLLKPNELATLLKLTTTLERQIVEAVPETVSSQEMQTTNSAASRPRTKAEDLAEVATILQSTGVLLGAQQVVETKTTTTLLGGVQ